MSFWEMAKNSPKIIRYDVPTTKHYSIITCNVNVLETQFKKFLNELTYIFKMWP